jgi:hypothetical protein
MMQLDLLTWKAPCRVSPFPLARRVGRVRRVAEVLAGKHGTAAVTYWKQTVGAIVGQMARAGIDDDRIRHELRTFHDAVQAEMWKRGGHGQRPGGNAA